MKIWILPVDDNFELCKSDLITCNVGTGEVLDIKETARENSPLLAQFETTQLVIWKTACKKSLDEVQEVLKNDRNAIMRIYANEQVADLGLSDDQSIVNKSLEDQAWELKEHALYRATLASPGSPHSNFSTIAPPIHIFHPIFHDLTQSVNDPLVQPTVEDLANVHRLMQTLSDTNKKEDLYRVKVREDIGRILDFTILERENPDNTGPDGLIKVEVNCVPIPCALFELDREAGEGGCDPISQASLSMKRAWIHEAVQSIREKTCCPTFLIAAGGPCLNIMGGIFTDRIIVQRLTGFDWMATSSTAEEIQIYDNARVLVALRKCLKMLEKYYHEIKTADIPDFVNHIPATSHTPLHLVKRVPRFVFEPTTDGDNMVAKTDGRVKVVVKFVTRYGEGVHKFLATEGWAPNLRYCSPLWKTGLHDDSTTRLLQSAPPGLRSNVMHMVVIDHVDAQTNPPPNAHHQLKEVLDRLHMKGYVHGDVREPNILFEGRRKHRRLDLCILPAHDIQGSGYVSR